MARLGFSTQWLLTQVSMMELQRLGVILKCHARDPTIYESMKLGSPPQKNPLDHKILDRFPRESVPIITNI